MKKGYELFNMNNTYNTVSLNMQIVNWRTISGSVTSMIHSMNRSILTPSRWRHNSVCERCMFRKTVAPSQSINRQAECTLYDVESVVIHILHKSLFYSFYTAAVRMFVCYSNVISITAWHASWYNEFITSDVKVTDFFLFVNFLSLGFFRSSEYCLRYTY